MTSQMIMFAGLSPHAPVLVPEVAGLRTVEVEKTVHALEELAKRLVAGRPELLLLVSPHSPRRSGSFGIWEGPRLRGSFSRFSAADQAVDLPVDEDAVAAIEAEAARRGLRYWRIREPELDHGATVPLWFLAQEGWTGPIVVLGLDQTGETSLEALGEALEAAAERLGRRTAFVASGDMSHRLCPGAPCGFNPKAHCFDEDFVGALERGDFAHLRSFDATLADLAAEDVVESTRVAVAAVGGHNEGHRFLSYEAPFGVGYSVAVLFDAGISKAGASASAAVSTLDDLPSVARRAIEAHFSGSPHMPDFAVAGEVARQGCVFVTLFDGEGELRGCIGSLHPTMPDLARETWHYALASLEDRRFARLAKADLPGVRVQVTVLGELQPVKSEEQLDPSVYGVVVRSDDGRRGVLLPDLEGIDSVKQQIAIARRKAGIAPWEEVELSRFTAECFEEKGDA